MAYESFDNINQHELQAVIEAIESVGITTSQPSPEVSQVDVFFHLPPSSAELTPSAEPK